MPHSEGRRQPPRPGAVDDRVHVRQPLGERDALVHEALALDGVRAAHRIVLGAEARDLFAQGTQLVELLVRSRELGRRVAMDAQLVELLAHRPQLVRRLGDERPEHELVGRRLGIGGQPFANRVGDVGDADLGLADVEPLANPVRDDVAGLLEEILDRGPREEAQMRVVEEARLAITELAAEERETDAAVSDVRDRGDDDAVLGDERADAAEDVIGLPQVLEDVGEEHDVELLAGELRGVVDLLGIAHDHALGVPLGELGGLGGDLDSGHRAAEPVLQHLGHVPRRATEFEHARRRRDERDDLAVGRARVVLELGVPEGVRRRCRGALRDCDAGFVFHAGVVRLATRCCVIVRGACAQTSQSSASATESGG